MGFTVYHYSPVNGFAWVKKINLSIIWVLFIVLLLMMVPWMFSGWKVVHIQIKNLWITELEGYMVSTTSCCPFLPQPHKRTVTSSYCWATVKSLPGLEQPTLGMRFKAHQQLHYSGVQILLKKMISPRGLAKNVKWNMWAYDGKTDIDKTVFKQTQAGNEHEIPRFKHCEVRKCKKQNKLISV